ncbi:hypothetical protein LUZ60_013582 [Juncus effusus]|nr:hypothetical protein LUZ60_013582 [Juncus effusus]
MEDLSISPEEQTRRNSETPAAGDLKRRGSIAARDWPPGCGGFAPHSDQSQPCDLPSAVSTAPDQPADESEAAGVSNGFEDLEEPNISEVKFDNWDESDGKSGGLEGQNGNSVENWGLGIKRRMKSTFYPPPKRRGIYAIRTFPLGCGLNLGLRDKGIEVETNNQENQPDKAEIPNETVLQQKDEKWISLHGEIANVDVKPIGENEDFNGKEAILHKEQVVKVELDDPILVKNVAFKGEGSSKKKKKKKRVKISENEKSKSDEFLMSEKQEEAEEVERSVEMKSEQSKEIVLFNVNNQEMYKTEELKEKKKKKKSNEKSKEKIDNSNTPLAIIPFEEHKAEENIAEYYDSDYDSAIWAIAESPKHPARKPAKKSISGPSKSLKKNKPKGTKKNTKTTIKEGNPKAQARFKGLSYELNLPPMNNKATDPRGKVRRILCIFQTLCRKKLQEEESKAEKDPEKSEPKSNKTNKKKKDKFRIDLKAAEDLKNSCEYSDPGKPVVGSVPGIEVGDEFRYRMELHLIGLHRPLQCGIDWTELLDGVRVATSIVSSGGYSDKFNDSGVLIYTGSGGKPCKKRKQSQAEDQKLEKGNLALKNSMDLKMPVRVIHGSCSADSKRVMTFTYDGLYMVESYEYVDEVYKEYCTKVFKFKLRRMAGQPELGLHMAAKTKEARVREGLCVADISEGKEKMPICAINTIDDEKPPKFKYITSIIYPSWYERMPPKGCDCNGKCSNLKNCKRCACALRNGGNLPFNSQRLIIETKDLVYECGPTCKCPPSCPNRVSQNGITIPLEIFKTESRGWGVRSLSSISSGSFICEYVGELLEDEEAEKLEKEDEYLFDIGKNYDDAPETDSGAGEEEEGFTIDAGKMGNVGRFINHSCSPNLYAQNVLFDHGDKRMPHVMFFAAKNIPPLQELTYYYNYRIGEVRDKYGNEKRKDCYCESIECEGRLY